MYMDDERLRWHLADWTEWHGDRPCDFGRSYPRRAGRGIRSGASQDFDSMVADVDRTCAFAVDAIVDSLPPIERASVHHFHLGSCFQTPIAKPHAERAYAQAQQTIKAGLKRRGIV
jgi:hypothetical protein